MTTQVCIGEEPMSSITTARTHRIGAPLSSRELGLTTGATTVTTEQPARAYSYIRFSTPEQAKGHSLQRQTEAARSWAAQHKVTLDDELTFEDKGVSGFTGANRETGALGTFLERVRDGTVARGAWLLVESLDRISRQAPRKAVRTLEDIIIEGVTVVDLSDGGRKYSAETLDQDHMLFIMMVVRFIRANEESTLKGARVSKAYANKRTTFASTAKLEKPYTRRLPAWITWREDTKEYALIEDRAALLRKIFERTDAGWGQHRVAAWLNAEQHETWGAGGWKAKYWHRSYIRKLLSNPAAIGVFVPHKMTPIANGGPKNKRTPLDAIRGRFPAAVDTELFERVNSRMQTTGARGKNARAPARSIFAGVIKCEHCGGTVTRVAKGGYVYLVCAAANAKAGTCRYESVPYEEAEAEVRRLVEDIVEEAPRGKNTADIEREIDGLEAYLDTLDDDIRGLLEARIEDKSTAAQRALREAEEKRETIADTLRERRDRRDALASANVTARLTAVREALTAEPMDTEAANKALRAAVRRMVMRLAEGTLEIYWHHADEPQEVRFVTRRIQSPFEAIEGGYSPKRQRRSKRKDTEER
jgi:DNA invertase Pin-like site-specific DNA recombinase